MARTRYGTVGFAADKSCFASEDFHAINTTKTAFRRMKTCDKNGWLLYSEAFAQLLARVDIKADSFANRLVMRESDVSETEYNDLRDGDFQLHGYVRENEELCSSRSRALMLKKHSMKHAVLEACFTLHEAQQFYCTHAHR